VEVGRSVLGRAWRLRGCDEAGALEICQRHGLADITGRVLAGRGLGCHEVEPFLAPRLRDHLPDPSHLLDLDRAAARVADAVRAGERVGLIGDYDVDGATSTALVGRYLRSLGAEVEVEIPDRLADGYGPNPQALGRLAGKGCRLVLTLDSGTTAFEALAHGRGLGLEVVVVDHHAAEPELPPALAVVNPNRQDQESGLKHLAAVGVSFVLLVAVSRELRAAGFFGGRPEPSLLGWLDLVALGTVCDVVPLTGLNRAFVHQGIRVAQRGGNLGLQHLARAAGLAAVDDARQLGFALGPRINAGGRTGRSALGARLLMTEDASEAAGLAERLDRLNRERQATERALLDEALRIAEEQVGAGAPVLVVAGEGWHQGVVGIVAARLVERHHRPAFVIGVEGGAGKGSARSTAGFDIGAAVIEARRRGILAKGGGHAMAAGLTVDPARLGEFAAFVRERHGAETGSGAGAVPEPEPLELDAALSVAALGADLARELERMAPFGPGNREPRFAIPDARLVEAKPVGDGHVSCVLAGPDGGRARGIAFRAGGTALGPALLATGGAPVRLAGRLRLDRYKGREQPSFQIEDAAAAGGA
jgi:single-stranded-DNA-specific exonuclease